MKKEHSKKEITDKWEQAVDHLGNTLTGAQKEGFHSNVENFEQYQKRQKLAFHKEFSKAVSQYKKAYEIIIEQFLEKSKTLKSNEIDKIFKEFKEGQNSLINEIENETLTEKIEEGKTFQEILGYTAQTLEQCYQIGLDLFENENYKDASAVFSLLTLLNPYFHNFWLCLAMSEQAQHHWEPALQAYVVAQWVDEKDPISYIYAAECHLRLKDYSHAIDNFDKAIALAKESKNPDYIGLAEAAKQRKEYLLQKR